MPSARDTTATAVASDAAAAAAAEVLAQSERLRQRNRQLLDQLALGQRAVHRAAATITRLPPATVQQERAPAASRTSKRGGGGRGPVTSIRVEHTQRPQPSSDSGADCASPALGAAARRPRTSPPHDADSRSVRKSLADEFADRSDDEDVSRVGVQPRRRLSPSIEGLPSMEPASPTPRGQSSPPAPSAAAETPKSILKRRRIIDDNVPVESRFRHTPGWMERIGRRGGDQREQRSLADVSERQLAEAAAARPRSVSFARTTSNPVSEAASDDESPSVLPAKQLHSLPSRRPLAELAINAGNYRPSAVALAAETPRRALKCGLGVQSSRAAPGLTNDAADGAADKRDALGGGGGSRTARVAGGSAATASPYRGRGGSRLVSPRARNRSPSSRRGPASAVAAAAAAAAVGERQHPLLGYDWIAALLDNEETPASVAAAAQLPDAFYEELLSFRRQNRDECVSQHEAATAAARQPAKSPLLTPSKPMVDAQAGDLPSPSHTCIHNYTVNQRLFAVPTNADESGRSRCPVCWRQRKSPTTTSPGFVRVSIPRATLMTPYKVRPHRRKSFDPSDSYALSKHCLAGWENQRPPPAVVARNVDLANETNRLKSKWTSTIKEAEELALKLKKLPLRSRDLDTTTLYTRQLKQIIEDLHNM